MLNPTAQGFSQASSRFSVVDVGGGKDAVDLKVKGAAFHSPEALLLNLKITSRVPSNFHPTAPNYPGLLRWYV